MDGEANGPASHGNTQTSTSTNAEARSFAQRNGYTKAVDYLDSNAAASGSLNAQEVMDVDGAPQGKAKSAKGAKGGKPETSATVKLDEFTKRNVPVATVDTASINGYTMNEDFIAQAEAIIERQKKDAAGVSRQLGASAAVDSDDRVRGYQLLRTWVEQALSGWKPELRELLYPIFVHTYLDLIDSSFVQDAKRFFQTHSESHATLHHVALSNLIRVDSSVHILTNPLVKQFRTEKYTVNLSHAAYGLFMGWLSDVGLEGLWDTSRDALTVRPKDAIRYIVLNRLELAHTNTAGALSAEAIVLNSGFTSSLLPPLAAGRADAFNSSSSLMLGSPQLPEQARKFARIVMDRAKEAPPAYLKDSSAARAKASGPPVNGGGVDEDDDMGEGGMNGVIRKPIPVQYLVPPLTKPDYNITKMDVEKELQGIRDERKRIVLGPKEKRAAGDVRASLPSVCLYTVFDNGEGTTSTAISQDSTMMAAGSAESCVRVWSLKGEPLRTITADELLHKTRGPDQGTEVRKLIGHSGPVYSVTFDPLSGAAGPPSHLLSASQDHSVRLWSLETWRNLVVYKGHSSPVWDVQWGPLGVHFATASRDKTARLWATDRVAPLRMFAGHLSDVNCVKFHPNSVYLATGSDDNTCRLWDIHRGDCVRVFLGHDGPITTTAFSPDGKYLASAGEDMKVILWDLGTGRSVKRMLGHTAAVQTLSFSSDSAILTSGGLDCTVRCWDVKTGINRRADADDSADLLSTFRTKRTPVTTIQYTPRNLCMAVGTHVPVENDFV